MEALRFELIPNKFDDNKPNASIVFENRGKEDSWVMGTEKAKALLDNLDTMKALCDAYTGKTAFRYIITIGPMAKEWKITRNMVNFAMQYRADLEAYVKKYWVPREVTLIAEPCTIERERGVQLDMMFLLPCYVPTEDQIKAFGNPGVENERVAWAIDSWEMKFFLDEAFGGELLEEVQKFLKTDAEKLVIPFTTKAGDKRDKTMNRDQASAFEVYSNWLLKASRNPEKYLVQ